MENRSRAIVLERWPNAKCVDIAVGSGLVAIVMQVEKSFRMRMLSGAFPTEDEAWAAAASRLFIQGS